MLAPAVFHCLKQNRPEQVHLYLHKLSRVPAPPDDQGVFFWSAWRPVARGKPGGAMGGWEPSKHSWREDPLPAAAVTQTAIPAWKNKKDGKREANGVHDATGTACVGSSEAGREKDGNLEVSLTCLK